MAALGEGDLLWEPTEEVRKQARVTRYMEWLGRGFTSYDDLWQWSVGDIDAFWESIWAYFDVIGERGDGPVRSGAGMPVDGITWFPGATLNYASNALRWARQEPGRTAVIFRSESGERRTVTFGELAAGVDAVRAGLWRLGVRKGDRVVAYVPNTPEALVFFLATASLGAIWSSCSPDFGAPSVIDRFTQIQPKVFVAVGGYHYNGKVYDRSGAVREIAAALPGLRATVLLGDESTLPDLPDGISYDELTGSNSDAGDDPPAEFEPVPFGHPLWIVYSSGTTGLPKAIVHGHGGVVLEHLKSLSFHQDLGPDDVFFWYTTTGWMMWNYLIGGLLTGTTVVMYDGSATHPETDALWRVAAEEDVTYFGTGAPYVLASMKEGITLAGMPRLRGVGSTGSPLPPEGFAWVYQAVGPRPQLGSFSGGTDLCTGFVGPSPLLPVRAGVIACRGLGAKVEAYGDTGEPVIDEVGELVITEPMPSMPVFFWNDHAGDRYRESYFDSYPGVWRHGDWIKVLPDGGCVIYGRSDSTLNRGGVRMGTSEFYRVVEGLDEVADSLVVDTGQLGAEGRLILYIQLVHGVDLSEDLIKKVRATLRTALSPRHAPDEVYAVPGIPRTLSGKKLEVPIRKMLLGTPIEKAANLDAMANPEVLTHFTIAGAVTPGVGSGDDSR